MILAQYESRQRLTLTASDYSGGHGARTRNPLRGTSFPMRPLAIRLPSVMAWRITTCVQGASGHRVCRIRAATVFDTCSHPNVHRLYYGTRQDTRWNSLSDNPPNAATESDTPQGRGEAMANATMCRGDNDEMRPDDVVAPYDEITAAKAARHAAILPEPRWTTPDRPLRWPMRCSRTTKLQYRLSVRAEQQHPFDPLRHIVWDTPRV